MDSRKKYEYWLEVAQYDLETAKVMMDGGRYVYVVFMCQQSIEKLTKGIYTLFTENEPPMIHNIWNIFKFIVKEVNFAECLNKDDEPFPEEEFKIQLDRYKSFFIELLSYYISGRYPTYKEKISNMIDMNRARKVLSTTEEVFTWIESLSQYKK